MAATDAQILQSNGGDETKTAVEISRKEVETAIAKVVELRALHASLVQGNSPVNPRLPSASPVHHLASQFSAHDYPVFTPIYEEEPFPGYQQIKFDDQTIPEYWEENGIGEGNGGETLLSDYKMVNNASSWRKGWPFELLNSEPHLCPKEDQKSIYGSSANNNISIFRSPDLCRSSRRHSLGDLKSLSSCNRCNPAILSNEADNNVIKNSKNSNIVVPLTDSSHSFAHSQPKNRGLTLSWLFPRLKKKPKNENSPNRKEPEEIAQVFEGLKKELMEANESRDEALMEVAEMKTSLGELKHKLEYLETYCEELKKALREAVQDKKDSKLPEKKRGDSVISIDGNEENSMPVGSEVMVEGFLQVVSESRLSVTQFCKTLVSQVEETDKTLMENLNSLLQPYKLSLDSKYSKAVLYHLEAIINQSLYQDFENSVFQKNGSPKMLDPDQDRKAQFSSFVALRNLSWNEVLRKGTKYYSEEFSKFCDQKMGLIVTSLNWTRPWPEELLQAFFVAAKCIWLVHLLAFSFKPALGILRVEEKRSFDGDFMEDVFMDRQRSTTNNPSRVKVMVTPGFYVQDRVLRCKVLCRYKSGN
ncbi:hypothetical protein U1Q18_032180 [Sarracenia purpurea var. burkii]